MEALTFCLHISYSVPRVPSGSQHMVPRPPAAATATAASPYNILEMQIFRPHF